MKNVFLLLKHQNFEKIVFLTFFHYESVQILLHCALSGHIYALKNIHISCFTNYTTWRSSNFYSTDRVDPDAPLEMKIKKKFLFRKGGHRK